MQNATLWVKSLVGKANMRIAFLSSVQDLTCTQIHGIRLEWFFLPCRHEVEHCCEQRGTQRYCRCLSLEWIVIFIQLQASSVVYTISSAALKNSKGKAEMSYSLQCCLQHCWCWAGRQAWGVCEYCIFLHYQSSDVLNIDTMSWLHWGYKADSWFLPQTFIINSWQRWQACTGKSCVHWSKVICHLEARCLQ